MPDPKGSLSGVTGLAERVRDAISVAARYGRHDLTSEGAELLDDYERAQKATPGDPLRTAIASRLYVFARKALDELAEHMKEQT